MTCQYDHAHDLEQQHRFEDEFQTIIDRAYETEMGCELVSALQKTLAGVIAADVIANGGGEERIHGIAAGVAEYIVQVHGQMEKQADETEADRSDANIDSRGGANDDGSRRRRERQGCIPRYVRKGVRELMRRQRIESPQIG
jgi:hypothetical protein